MIKGILNNVAGVAKKALVEPEQSQEWHAGWHDNSERQQNMNPHEPGTAEHADYERGFEAYRKWLDSQW